MIEGVLANMKDLTTLHLKRLLKNAQYIFPKNFDHVDPHLIRDLLLDSFKERTATGEKIESIEQSSSRYNIVSPSQDNTSGQQVQSPTSGISPVLSKDNLGMISQNQLEIIPEKSTERDHSAREPIIIPVSKKAESSIKDAPKDSAKDSSKKSAVSSKKKGKN